MIKAHQPTIFGSSVTALLSSVEDGNMRKNVGDRDEVVDENRRKFLSAHMIALQTSVLCNVTYDRADFTRYTLVRAEDKGKGMMPHVEMPVTDGLATDEKRIALFLPPADCIGAILYDPKRQALMVSHLGRHSAEQYGAIKSVEFMHDSFGTKPQDLLVWLGPAPNGTDYPLWARDNKSFRDVTVADLEEAGILREHIEISDVDTVTDRAYFSHSEFLKGNRETDGRYAIVAMLR